MTRFLAPDAVGPLSDEEWLKLLERSLTDRDVDGIEYPTFPDDQTQANFVGHAREAALLEAVRFLRYTLDALSAIGGPAPAECEVVDFGSGWGRITRALLRDFRPEHVIGVDPLDSMVAACRDWFAGSPVSFETVDNWPPLPQANASVDLIVAYSVFSHLPERLATAWIAEFARVLKPGGIVVATTQSRSFIDLCEQIRTDDSVGNPDFLWHQLLARSFVDAADAYRRFDAGEFLHEANGGGDSLEESLYGDSLFSGEYVTERWGHLLAPARFEDKPYDLPQAVFVLQKPTAGGAIAAGAWRADEVRVDALEQELRELRSSETWRIGQAALAPVRLARRVKDRLAR